MTRWLPAPLLRSSTKNHLRQQHVRYYHQCNRNASCTYRRSNFILCSRSSSYNLCHPIQQQLISRRQYYGSNKNSQLSIIAAPSSIMTTSAATVRKLSLFSMSKGNNCSSYSMNKKSSINHRHHHLNFFSH